MRSCEYCRTTNAATLQHCRNCGAALPIVEKHKHIPLLLVCVGLALSGLMANTWLSPKPQDLDSSLLSKSLGQMIYTDPEPRKLSKPKILSIKVLNETEQTLMFAVEFNYVGELANRNRLLVVPNLEDWRQQEVIITRTGVQSATVLVSLDTDKLHEQGKHSLSSTYLEASIEKISLQDYSFLGILTKRVIPYPKNWQF